MELFIILLYKIKAVFSRRMGKYKDEICVVDDISSGVLSSDL